MSEPAVFGDCARNEYYSGDPGAQGPEAFNEHIIGHDDCEIEAASVVHETFRVDVEAGIAFIAKNTNYEVIETTWHCLTHEVDLSEPEHYEWST